MDAQLHIKHVFRVFEPFRPILVEKLANSGNLRSFFKIRYHMGIMKRKIQCWVEIHWKSAKSS